MTVQISQPNTLRFSTNEDLLESIKQNDHAAFEYLFKRFYPRLLGYAIRFVQDEDVAKDILQECFMNFWEKRQLLSAVSISSLLFLMVRNACLNYLKHHMLANYLSIDYLSTLDGEEKLYSADLMFSTDENILYEDLKTQIDAALSKLSPRSREIFLLSRFDGMKNKEIAELLGISTTAVEKHISKSLKVISDYLKDNSSYYQYIVIMSFFLFTK
ncbi:RNA polymerase sigma-70 factor [Bacteroides gallinaceum]|uniref:RNA polymerase sigma-70 factor n=1 Tax=Bacteroides gallinaceum TaxID=1462571 RepID=A0ABT7VDW0_9BACE|nr:RNA polymerase sigma-70 factor [Bacteroides gallinaceum]MBW9200025.1 RNA polymerase sigma-70 factor [Bacteroidales bacterium SW299]MDM8324489.1 RNA polymerase sigma-70 factor [Bacteroides gallinaceum]